ncbi:hypothetical protein [Streptomyces sp. NPDC052721]|uniref:hypothetical protein n=1 Tax=Streptomyces sp. NPDC052721 TaxID=3154955 RepID=UPI0034270E23
MHFAIAGREHELAYLRVRDSTEEPGRMGPRSKVMRCYREEDDGFEENALHGLL